MGHASATGRPRDMGGGVEDQLLAQWQRRCARGHGRPAQSRSVLSTAEAAKVLDAVLSALDGDGPHSPLLEQAARRWAQTATPITDIVLQLGFLRDLLLEGHLVGDVASAGHSAASSESPAASSESPEASSESPAASSQAAKALPTTSGSSQVDRRARLQAIVDRVAVIATETAVTMAERAALTDPLTRVGNRRAMIEAGRAAVAAARRSGYPLSVLSIDLDGLKALNDTAGHGAGDGALAELARAVSQALRQSDQLFRVGGDEFVAIMPLVGTADVADIVERAAHFGAPRFSWGRADLGTDGDTLEELLAAADRRLYAGRQRRRAGLVHADGPAEMAGVVGEAWPAPQAPAATALQDTTTLQADRSGPPVPAPPARRRAVIWAMTLLLVCLAIAVVALTLVRLVH